MNIHQKITIKMNELFSMLQQCNYNSHCSKHKSSSKAATFMKRRGIIFCRLVLLPALLTVGCSSLRDQLDSVAMVTDWPTRPAWRVAVLDCETTQPKERIDKGVTVTAIDEAGVKMAEAVAGLLGQKTGYLVVDRDLMLQTLRDHSLPTSGIPSADKLAEIGRVLEVDGLVLGRFEGWHWGNRYEWGEKIKASLWLIMAESGRTAWSVEGRGVLVGSDQEVIPLLARDMVKKVIAGSGEAEPPAGLSTYPVPYPGEPQGTPTPPLRPAHPVQPSLSSEKAAPGIDEVASLPDEFSSIAEIQQAFSDSKIKGWGEPASIHLNQSGYDLFVIWVNPFSGRKANYSFAYSHNPRSGKWNILDRSFQKGEDSLRNVYIDPGTGRLIYIGENGKIIREIPLDQQN